MNDRARALEEMNRWNITRKRSSHDNWVNWFRSLGQAPFPQFPPGVEEGSSIRLFSDQSWYNRKQVEGIPVGIM
jgi:hypothetical protein